MPPSRLNNFQRILSRNNPNLVVNRTNNGRVRVKHTRVPQRNRNNVYSIYKNNSPNHKTLTINAMNTNNAYRGLKYQSAFLRAAERAAKNAGYNRLNAHSVYIIITNNNIPRANQYPNSYYVLTSKGFKVASTKGILGRYTRGGKINRNSFSAHLVKNL